MKCEDAIKAVSRIYPRDQTEVGLAAAGVIGTIALGAFGGAAFGVAGLTTAAAAYTWERMKSKLVLVDVSVTEENGKLTVETTYRYD